LERLEQLLGNAPGRISNEAKTDLQIATANVPQVTGSVPATN
jgi:hypothetical protein